jgi:hypothetical protein
VIQGASAGVAQLQASTSGSTRLFGRVQTEGGATEVKIVLSPMGTPGQFAPAKLPSRVGKPLPSLADLGIDPSAAVYRDKVLLLCFFDMSQRPSRHCLGTLAQQADTLGKKGVQVVAVQAAEADGPAVAQWAKEQSILWPIQTAKGDMKKQHSAWAVQSLPWLILADKNHVIRAEGFSLDELDGLIARTAEIQK